MNNGDEQQLLKDIARKEIEYGLYDPKINGLSIYSFIRFRLRNSYLERIGAPSINPRQGLDKKTFIISAIISLWDFVKLLIKQKHYSIVFFSFPRIDKIGKYYLDKYTDPLISEAHLTNDYIIFDHGRAGAHPCPRYNSSKVVYLDILSIHSKLCSALLWFRFYKKNKDGLDKLYSSLQNVFGAILPLDTCIKAIYSNYLYSKALCFVFKSLSAKCLIGPARSYMVVPFYAAHTLGIRKYEIQHGVTYDETSTYTGFQDPMVMPDMFLAFGNNKPSNVYGIDESRIVNIGWALQDYVAKLPQKEAYQEKDVLVISDPEVTDAIFEVVLKLAEDNPDSTFYIRPHPHDIITEQQLNSISSKRNIKIQDKGINITVVLQGFKHVIGENSTVLYEALAVKKKVGRLFYKGLNPKYLEESDRECFWEIHNQDEFERFISEDITIKKSKSIYSKFNKELFCKTVGIES